MLEKIATGISDRQAEQNRESWDVIFAKNKQQSVYSKV